MRKGRGRPMGKVGKEKRGKDVDVKGREGNEGYEDRRKGGKSTCARCTQNTSKVTTLRKIIEETFLLSASKTDGRIHERGEERRREDGIVREGGREAMCV